MCLLTSGGGQCLFSDEPRVKVRSSCGPANFPASSPTSARQDHSGRKHMCPGVGPNRGPLPSFVSVASASASLNLTIVWKRGVCYTLAGCCEGQILQRRARGLDGARLPGPRGPLPPPRTVRRAPPARRSRVSRPCFESHWGLRAFPSPLKELC